MACILALSFAAPLLAASMNAEVFYVKAVALKKKGVGAILSKDMDILKGEMNNVRTNLRAENEKAKKTGKPLYCPPKNSSMSSDQLISELSAAGQTKRKQMTMHAFMRDYMVRKYPCK
ncbi:hypothetical protein [Sphingorhabdus lutea]|nr:hypothetical protein [Sphingorhabdus lutea]